MRMLKPAEVEDCSRDYLEHWAGEVEKSIAAGREDLKPLLARIRAAIPSAPSYFIEHTRG